MELDAALRRQIYDRTLSTGTPPTIAELADAIGVAAAAVRNGLASLAAGRMLVVQPGTGEILMAPPFSAVPTAFYVTAGSVNGFANCVGDALGVLAILHRDGEVTTACGCCAAAMALNVSRGELAPREGIVHFAVPARRWWDNIVFT